MDVAGRQLACWPAAPAGRMLPRKLCSSGAGLTVTDLSLSPGTAQSLLQRTGACRCGDGGPGVRLFRMQGDLLVIHGSRR